jgi:hypothetical protein
MGTGFVERTRESVLRECVLARERWEQAPARNLVLLFDGTGNILGNGADTNVVKLLRLLKKQDPDADGPGQVVYYDPGVGTNNDFPPAGITSRFRMVLGRLRGLAEGDGAFDNVAEAYEFLCRSWRPGDRIFLFGFSRGAFTARAVGSPTRCHGPPAAGAAVRSAATRRCPGSHGARTGGWRRSSSRTCCRTCSARGHRTGSP